MSAAENRAVFLSYASQDAEAARRICEALRSAGIEVWFDAEGGLEHGDEWDAKIRRQIKECVLFIAVISANTQAREEGYFRIEWELAAQRALGIASGVAFILPMVIDDTREPEALVPDRFRVVQWTRLPGGVVTPQVQQRLLKLWSHRIGVTKQEAASALSGPAPGQRLADAGGIAAATSQPRRRWLLMSSAGLVAAALAIGWWSTRPPTGPAQAPSADTAARPGEGREITVHASAAQTEAQQLTRRAHAIYQQAFERDQLELAQDLARKATELDPAFARAWATRAEIEALFLLRGWAPSPARVRDAQSFAHRALGLNPAEPDALVALGLTAAFQENARAAEEYYRRALALAPENHTIRRYLGIALRTEGRIAEALTVLQDAVQRAPTDALMHYDLALTYHAAWDVDNAWRANEIAFGLRRFSGPPLQMAWLAATAKGDLALMRQWLDRIDISERGIDAAIFADMWCGLAERNLEHVLAAARRGARDYLENDHAFTGPKAWFTGLAYRIAGMENRARQEWTSAVGLLRERQRAHPGRLHAQVAITFALLGQADEAARELALVEPIWREQLTPAHAHILARYYAVLGDATTTVALLRRAMPGQNGLTGLTVHQLKLDPWWDRVRATPEFKALLADPPIPAAITAKPGPSQEAKPAASARESTLTKGNDKSVAVLALANLSDDKENEYFSDGISEELLNVLAKVPGLRVAARTSAFYFKGKNATAQEIGQKLGVAYLVEGSVRKAGTKVRIAAGLSKSDTGEQLWSESYERELKDIFAVQDEIARDIAGKLQLTLGGTTRRASAVNPEAHRLVLEGRHFWNLRTDDGFTRAEAAFQRALALDPQFAQAHAGLADVAVMRAAYRVLDGDTGIADDIARTREEVARALALDASLAEPRAALAFALKLERKLPEAELEYQKALALNPNYAVAHMWRGVTHFYQGRIDTALEELEKATTLDPLSFINVHMWSEALALAGRVDEALAMNARAAALRADVWPPNRGEQAVLWWRKGRADEAVAAARSVRQLWPQKPRYFADGYAIWVLQQAGLAREASDYAAQLLRDLPETNSQRGFVLAALGRFDEAVPYLERSGVMSDRSLFWAPMWDAYRDDPRFHQLLVKLGCAEEYKIARETLARLRREPEAKR